MPGRSAALVTYQERERWEGTEAGAALIKRARHGLTGGRTLGNPGAGSGREEVPSCLPGAPTESWPWRSCGKPELCGFEPVQMAPLADRRLVGGRGNVVGGEDVGGANHHQFISWRGHITPCA